MMLGANKAVMLLKGVSPPQETLSPKWGDLPASPALETNSLHINAIETPPSQEAFHEQAEYWLS